MENKDTVRVSIRISKRLKEYFERRSRESGAPQSVIMALALEEYMYQRETQDFMSKFSAGQIEIKK